MPDFEKDVRRISAYLGWTVSISESNDSHQCTEYSVSRDETLHRFAYLNSQSTDRTVYRKLEQRTEVIFVSSFGFKEDNFFSNGCKVPVLPDHDLLYVITDWNLAFLGVKPSSEESAVQKRNQNHINIIEENPLQQIYTQLESLTSRSVARQAVMYHSAGDKTIIGGDIVSAKAEGISYLVQNAIDYYDRASTNNMTQRLLNLYYGTVALMEAEMLVYGDQYSNLSEIENVTKSGHGMMTFGNAVDLNDFYIGVLDKGLFQAWLSHRGINTSDFPESRKKAEKSEFNISLDDLFRHIPELQNVMQEAEAGYKPYFLFPSYDSSLNYTSGLRKPVYERKYQGSYVDFLNLDGPTDYDWEETLIQSFLAPITIIGKFEDISSKSQGWRTFVKHKKNGYHYESYHTHKGLSASMVIAPLFERNDDWEVFAVMILYSLSIIVRYMPNLWARILHGDLDYYKAILYQFSRVADLEIIDEYGDDIPALLPQVYLYYDSKVQKERLKKIFDHQCMDFLMLISESQRIVFELDGVQHYAGLEEVEVNGNKRAHIASVDKYARMVSAQRDMTLAGYEVYRFGGKELYNESGRNLVKSFFKSLFEKYGIIEK